MNEFIPSDLMTSPTGDRVRGAEQYKDVKYRFSLDLAIAQIALAKKIPIHSLDAGMPEIDQRWEQLHERISKNPAMIDVKESNWMTRVFKMSKEPRFLPLYNSVIKGDVQSLEKLRDSHDVEQNNREDHWCKTLIPALTKTNKPVCIVVGVAHVIGGDGLASRFQLEGLSVRLIQNASKNP
jgi:hypothetical protein